MIYEEDKIVDLYPDIKPGGEWQPKNCVARQKIAILVPFKNRHQHLLALLNVLHPFLRRQKQHYRIFVVDQACSVHLVQCDKFIFIII